MSILVFNCGSSSLKSGLFDVVRVNGSLTERALWSMTIGSVGGPGHAHISAPGGTEWSGAITTTDHGDAVQATLDALQASLPSWRTEVTAAGHRIVHGGHRFREPALLDEEVTAYLDSLTDIAPLHNAPALAAVARTRSILGANLPLAAVFDTAFHSTIPEHAAQYAIPHELTTSHEIYRYGFHGLAHRDMAEQFARLNGANPGRQNVVTFQLGSGCSVAAVRNGRSVDTSMGFTPVEGLVMGTRSGDIDPTVATFLAKREGVTVEEVGRWLNTRSGLLGVSGRSSDVRDLLQAEAAGDQRAGLALEMFCYRARKYLGAYMAALNGVDGIVFGGGIGEHAPTIRARICEGMEWAGLTIDHTRNAAVVGMDGMITADDSRVQAYVATVDEERLIARETFALLDPPLATSPA